MSTDNSVFIVGVGWVEVEEGRRGINGDRKKKAKPAKKFQFPFYGQLWDMG